MAKKHKSRSRISAPSHRRVAPLRGRTSATAMVLDLPRCQQFVEHEARLLDDLRQMDQGQRDKGAIRLHLSRLQPEYRSAENLRNAEIVFDELTKTRSAWLYRLPAV